MASWGERLKRRLLIGRLRSDLAFFGIDLSNMSDEEVIQHCEEIQRQVSVAADAMAISVQQMSEAFRKLAEAMARIDLEEYFPPRDKDTLTIRVLPRD
jgi:predicted CopG family antitoxin